MRRHLSPPVSLRRAISTAGFTSTFVIALLGACGLPGEDGDGVSSSGVDEVKRSGLTVDNAVAWCYPVVGGAETRVTSDGNRYYIYTVGSNTAAIYCPIVVPSTTNGVALTQIAYIDSNGGGLTCQVHSKKGGADVYSRKLVSTRNTTPVPGSNGLFQTTDFSAVLFDPGSTVRLECIMGPGALLVGYKYAR